MSMENLPVKPIIEEPMSHPLKGFLLAAYRSVARVARLTKITRTLLVSYLLILVIIPPVFITIAFLAIPSKTASFFNFQVRAPLSPSENPNSQVLAASTSGRGSVLGEYVAAVLEPQAVAVVQALRIANPVPVEAICLPTEPCAVASLVVRETVPSGPAGPVGVSGLTGPQGLQGPVGPVGSVGSLTTGDGLSGSLTDGDLTLDLDSVVPTSTVNDTNVTGSLKSNELTLGWSGLLSPVRGGTGVSSCSDGQVLAWDSATSSWVCSASGVGGVSSLNSLSGPLTLAGGGINTIGVLGSTVTVTGTIPSLDPTYFATANVSQWTNDSGYITDGNIGWDNSYGFITDGNTGWDNSYGFITSADDTVSGLELDGVFSSTGLLVRTGAATYTTATDNSANWDTAYSHSNATTNVHGLTFTGEGSGGGLDADTVDGQHAVAFLTGSSVPSDSGDIDGDFTNGLTIEDDSHAHTGATISGLSVTDFTSANISQWTNDSGYITDGNIGWDNSYGFITASSSDTLSNKTIVAGSNTISGLTNSNLSGTAGITDANLATISTAGKVSGSAIQLNTNGGITNSTGLTLLTTCGSGEILKWNGSAWACAADSSGGSSALNTITAALGTNTINNGDNAQIWNWNLTTAAKTAFTFGENTASTNGAGSQYILGLSTLVGSTAAPLKVSARGNTIINTTSTGGLTFGNTTANTPITLQSGTGAINIGADSNAKTITFGNTTGATAVNINSGTGNINLNVGSTASSGRVQIGNSATTTPDVLVLDNGTSDPTGAAATNGASYYNTSTNKFRCYENSAWKDCDTSGLNNIKTAQSNVAASLSTTETSYLSVTITPTSATKNIWITGSMVVSNNSSNATVTLRVRQGSDCTGTQVGSDVNFKSKKDNNANYTGVVNVIGSPGTTSAVTYQLCAVSTSSISSNGAESRQITAAEVKLGADLAEVYNSLDTTLASGEIVAVDGTIDGGAKRSDRAYQNDILGIVSTNPGMVISGPSGPGKPILVALSGRVPVNVSTENGSIKPGDSLTSSGTPGVAMKATKAGAIIGTAMTSFDGEEIGQVLVFVKNSYSMGSSDVSNESIDSVKTEAEIEVNIIDKITKAVLGLFKKTVEFFGSVVFHSDVAFLGRPTFNKDTAGHVLIKAGDKGIEIVFEKEYASDPVVTASINLAGGMKLEELPEYAIYDLSTKGFKIKLSQKADFDISFSWIALAVDEDQVSTGVLDTPAPSAIPLPIPAESAPNQEIVFTPETTESSSSEQVVP